MPFRGVENTTHIIVGTFQKKRKQEILGTWINFTAKTSVYFFLRLNFIFFMFDCIVADILIFGNSLLGSIDRSIR